MADPHFRARFVDVPAILEDWFKDFRSVGGAEMLDFGCGEGITALGVAMGFPIKAIVGVDLMPDPDRCLEVAKKHLQIQALPTTLQLHRVEPGHLHNATDRFDLAYSWSVFEHVDQTLIDHSLSLIHRALRPGGLFFVQIAPLYYSAEGSHLVHVLHEPWIHLRMQHNRLEDKLRRMVQDEAEAEALWSTYCTLNRITHQDLIERLRRNRFEVLRSLTTKDKLDAPDDLVHSFTREALTTNQIVVLARAI